MPIRDGNGGAAAGAIRAGAPIAKLALVGAIALLTANCAQQRSAGVDPKYGVKPSPRVVEEGDPVPKGGGRAMVGKPYQVAGRTYVPRHDEDYSREGWASWYGPSFHGRMTANGEVFDKYSVSAAHPTMPLPSYARITNVKNKRSIIVRVNDRGPFHGNRIVDVSLAVAEALDFRRAGMARVRVDYVAPASTRGSDDRTLLATLRTDGQLASLPGSTAPATMVASAERTPAPSPVSSPALAARTAGPPANPVLAFLNGPASREAASTPLPAPAQAEASAPAAAIAEGGRIVQNVPTPPSRPFDLGPLRGTTAAVTLPPVPRRTSSLGLPGGAQAYAATSTGMFYAPPDAPAAGFSQGGPFDTLRPQRFVNLRN